MDSSARVSKITDIKVIEINVGQDGRVQVKYALADPQGITYGGGEYAATSEEVYRATLIVRDAIQQEMLKVFFNTGAQNQTRYPDASLFDSDTPIIPTKKGGQPLTESNLEAREDIGEPMDYLNKE